MLFKLIVAIILVESGGNGLAHNVKEDASDACKFAR